MPKLTNKTSVRIYLMLMIVIICTSCVREKNVNNLRDDIDVDERCYDGVVYIEDTRYTNLTVKMKSNGTISTVTKDGKHC